MPSPDEEPISIAKIQRVVADYFNLSIEDMKAKRELTQWHPRQICHTVPGTDRLVLAQDWRRVWRPGSYTVMHAQDKIRSSIETNPSVAHQVEAIKKLLRN